MTASARASALAIKGAYSAGIKTSVESDEILVVHDRIFLPDSKTASCDKLAKDVLDLVHLAIPPAISHVGKDKMARLLETGHIWMQRFHERAQIYLNNCISCVHASGPFTESSSGGLIPSASPQLWELAQGDAFGLSPASDEGFESFIGFIDVASRSVAVSFFQKKVQSLTADDAVQAFLRYRLQFHTWPKVLLTDRGSIFNSKTFIDFCSRETVNVGLSPFEDGDSFPRSRVQSLLAAEEPVTSLEFGTPGNSRGRGVIERFGRTFKNALRKSMKQQVMSKWYAISLKVLIAYGLTPHSSLGFMSPDAFITATVSNFNSAHPIQLLLQNRKGGKSVEVSSSSSSNSSSSSSSAVTEVPMEAHVAAGRQMQEIVLLGQEVKSIVRASRHNDSHPALPEFMIGERCLIRLNSAADGSQLMAPWTGPEEVVGRSLDSYGRVTGFYQTRTILAGHDPKNKIILLDSSVLERHASDMRHYSADIDIFEAQVHCLSEGQFPVKEILEGPFPPPPGMGTVQLFLTRWYNGNQTLVSAEGLKNNQLYKLYCQQKGLVIATGLPKASRPLASASSSAAASIETSSIAAIPSGTVRHPTIPSSSRFSSSSASAVASGIPTRSSSKRS
jgi:hypothetical protein